MRILADYHHSDLFESLELTLADRLGHTIYRPIGMEWFDAGIWNFERAYHGDAVAKQYLAIWDTDRDCGDHWERDDTTHPGRVHRMLTLEQARAADLDIVLCTLTHNERGMGAFASEIGARFGIQAGNVGQVANVALEGGGWDQVGFALLSTTTGGIPVPVPHVIYRQEFSLSDFRAEWPPAEPNSISSFVQCFPENAGPTRGNFYDEFTYLARTYPEFRWQVYGAYGSAPLDGLACGNLGSTPAVAERMRATRMAWHAKFWSDGFGHVIHNLFAVGCPTFAYFDYYADKLAGPLMIDGETAFDLATMAEADVIAVARRLRDDDEYHRQISSAAAARFREIVDFDGDADAIRALIG